MMRTLVAITIIILSSITQAELVAINDEQLANESGQGVIKVEEFPIGQGIDNSDIDKSFTRITLGMDINVNGNIKTLMLGQGDRPDGIDNSDGNAIADIHFTNVSMGEIDANGNMTDLQFKDPFIEFARDANDNLIGFRLGFGQVDGILGSTIETLSGDVEAVGELDLASIGLIGTLDLDSESHGIREDEIFDSLLGFSFDLGNFKTLQFTNTQNMYLGVQSTAINYPRNGNGPQGVAQPGFWMNLQDGAVAPNVQLIGFIDVENAAPNNHFASYYF